MADHIDTLDGSNVRAQIYANLGLLIGRDNTESYHVITSDHAEEKFVAWVIDGANAPIVRGPAEQSCSAALHRLLEVLSALVGMKLQEQFDSFSRQPLISFGDTGEAGAMLREHLQFLDDHEARTPSISPIQQFRGSDSWYDGSFGGTDGFSIVSGENEAGVADDKPPKARWPKAEEFDYWKPHAISGDHSEEPDEDGSDDQAIGQAVSTPAMAHVFPAMVRLRQTLCVVQY